MLTLNNLVDYLESSPRDDCIYWISIGSASNICSNRPYVLNRNMHQFPPFLQEYNYNSKVNLRLILIDEMLSTPPYVVTHILGNQCKKHNIYNNIYYANNIEIISCNEYIEYDRQKYNYSDSTYKLFDKINNYILKANNNLLFVHDFSGYNCAYLAEHFDQLYISNKIMYDITVRSDRSCIFDLENKLYKPIIKDFNIFNPVYLSNSELYELFEDDLYKPQIQLYLKGQYNILKDKLYPIYRRIYTFIIKNYNYEFKKENNYQDNILSIQNLKRNVDFSIIDYINNRTFQITSTFILETENELFNAYKDSNDITLLMHILFSIKDTMMAYIKRFLEIIKIDEIKINELIETAVNGLIFNDPYTYPKFIEDNILIDFIKILN